MQDQEVRLGVGTKVQVRNRFLAEFRPGFEVAEVVTGGYVLRRLSDGERLPAPFGDDDVLPDA